MRHFILKCHPFYQDRLGTNKRKTQKVLPTVSEIGDLLYVQKLSIAEVFRRVDADGSGARNASHLLRHFVLKMIILPRKARDKS